MAETAVATRAPAAERVRKSPCLLVFGTLAAVTAVELAITTPGYFPTIEATLRVVVLVTLSTMKASLVVAYYMHLRYEPRWLLLIPLGGFALVMVLVVALVGPSLTGP